MKYLTLALLVLGINTQAAEFPFNGGWAGRGSITVDKETTACDSVEMIIDQRENALIIRMDQYLCSTTGINFGTMAFGVKDGVLYIGTDKVGSINDHEAKFEYEQNVSNYQAKWIGHITLENGKMKITETQIVTARGKTETATGTAILTKTN